MSAHTTAAATAEQPTPRERPPRAGWTQVPRPFLDTAPLDNDRLAHVLLMSYAWDEDNDCHPYQRELADELGCSVRTVKRRTADLRAEELVTVRRGGRGARERRGPVPQGAARSAPGSPAEPGPSFRATRATTRPPPTRKIQTT